MGVECCTWRESVAVMFSAVEIQYLQALVETMRGQGYKYYIARTVTESGNDFDLEVVFSAKEITAAGMYQYQVRDGVRYRVDSSGSSTNNRSARVDVGTANGNYSVPVWEHVYTNAVFDGSILQPDVRELGGVTHEWQGAVPLLLALLVLVLFVFRVFR